MNEATQTLLDLLGADPRRGRKPVLLPITALQKFPTFHGWQKVTWEEMHDNAYIARLDAHENTGVILGPDSGGLCTIDIDRDDYVQQFLDLNPRLRKSLRTRGSRGCQIWMWMQEDPKLIEFGIGSFPSVMQKIYHLHKRTKVPGPEGKLLEQAESIGEWRGGGGIQSVVCGVHPDGHRYQILESSPPADIVFREIVWPDFYSKPWRAEWNEALEDRFGPPTGKMGEEIILTDHYWAGHFALLHDIVYEPIEKSFFQYDPVTGAWIAKTRNQLIAEVSRDILNNGRNLQLRQMEFNTSRNSSRIGGIVTFIEGETTKPGIFDRPPGIIHLRNGMINLSDRAMKAIELEPFAARFYSRNPIPWNYESGKECPNFKKILLEPALDADDISLLQRCAGAMIMGFNIAQKILILTGTAGGGKTTLVKLLNRVIGQHNVADLRTKHLGERFELTAYVGKTLLTGADVRGDFLQQQGASALKSLVGGDNMEAEQKSGNKRILIRGNYNVVVTCNSRLVLRLEDDAPAWRRRLVIINYDRPPVEEKDKIDELEERLLNGFPERGWEPESSGILNWCIEGAMLLLNEVRKSGTIFMTAKQKQRTESLLGESESVRRFIEVCIETTDKELKLSVTTEELLEAYREFCAEMGWNAKPDTAFMNESTDLILRIHRTSKSNDIEREKGDRKVQKRGYRHLRIKTEFAFEK